jgi:hypothetical protein
MTFHGDDEVVMRALLRQISPAQYDQMVQGMCGSMGYQGTVSHAEVSRAEDMSTPVSISFDYKREKAGDWEHLKTVPEVMPALFPQVTEMEPPVHAIELVPQTKTSTSAMKLPQGWSAVLPPAVHAKCAYATYDMTYRLEDGIVYADRSIVVLAKKVPVNDWRAYKAFVDIVNPGKERYIQLMTTTPPNGPWQRTKQVVEALNSPDPKIRNMAMAGEDARYAGIASGYAMQLVGSGEAGASRLAASRAAMNADKAAAAVEMAAASVESDASEAATAAAAGDKAAISHARDKAASDESALLATDNQLAKAAKELVAAAARNAAFLSQNSENLAINDMATRDSSAAANLLSTATKGGNGGYTAAAADAATAMKDANLIAGFDPARASAFQAAAKAEAAAQSAATAAASGGSAPAVGAEIAAASTAGAAADGSGNPYAGAVEMGAAAIANAASATLAAQQTMNELKASK